MMAAAAAEEDSKDSEGEEEGDLEAAAQKSDEQDRYGMGHPICQNISPNSKSFLTKIL